MAFHWLLESLGSSSANVDTILLCLLAGQRSSVCKQRSESLNAISRIVLRYACAVLA